MKDMDVLIEDGNVRGYKVNLAVTFVLEDVQEGGSSGDTPPFVPDEAPRSVGRHRVGRCTARSRTSTRLQGAMKGRSPD